MRVVIQRVTQASVTVNEEVVGQIGLGFCILAGFEQEENQNDLVWCAEKIANLRIFSDDQDKMNRSIIDVGGDILLISQFTLHAKTKKGNRPSFISAAKPEEAMTLYRDFGRELEMRLKKPIQYGRFGEMMSVLITNEGPVTIIIDTKKKE